MMNDTKANHRKRKDKAMYERFSKLSSVKEHGVTKYSVDWIMAKLEEEFYLDQRTIMVRLKAFARNRHSADDNQLRIELPM